MKKFYKLVSTKNENGAYVVQLDGRPVKCPSGAVLAAPNEALAEAIAAEWIAQDTEILPDTMPLTQILTTRIDRVTRERAGMEAALFKYIDTDLLCYRAGDDPPGQREAQEKAWDQWLDWFEGEYGVKLGTTSSIAALAQPPEAHEKIRKDITALDDDCFTAFQLIAAQGGSIILALAAMKCAASPQQIFDAAHVEENFKAAIYDEEKYGASPNEEKQRKDMIRHLEAAAKYLDLL